MSPARARWGIALASLVVQIPFLERGISLLDEGSILAIAQTLANGGRLYVDAVTPFAPLTYETVSLLISWLGPHQLVARAFQALVFSGCAMLAFEVLRELAPVRWALAGAVALLALKPLAFPAWTLVNYSQLAMLFVLACWWASLRFLARGGPWLALAGLLAGAALVTKQNLGILVAAVGALGVAAGAWAPGGRRGARLAREGVIFASTAALAPLGFLSLYALRGDPTAFVRHAAAEILDVAGSYAIGLPPLALGLGRGEPFGPLAFAYFPGPLADLMLQGRLDLRIPPLRPCIGLFVLGAYLLPLAALVPAALWAVRDAIRSDSRPAARWLLLVALAAGSYASMLYRADWTHLMNVYPPLLVLMTATLARWSGSWPPARGLALVLVGTWLMGAAAVGLAAVVANGSAVDSPRGRLLGTPAGAREARRVIAHLDALPAGERIALLPAIPLHYWLSGRLNPLPHDLLLPGIVRSDGDRRAAEALSSVDRVLYDATPVPFVQGALPEFAPRTAGALARDFQPVGILSDTTFEFVRRAVRPYSAPLVVDLWDRFESEGRGAGAADGGGFRRTHWLMYRVLAATLESGRPSACLERVQAVGAAERLLVVPLFDPPSWAPGRSPWSPASGPARFEVSARPAGSGWVALDRRTLAPGLPGAPLEIPLEPFAGREVALRLCVHAVGGRSEGGLPSRPARAGWAEPRIVAGGPPGARERALP